MLIMGTMILFILMLAHVSPLLAFIIVASIILMCYA